jgi:hypothetical protein
MGKRLHKGFGGGDLRPRSMLEDNIKMDFRDIE